MLRVGHCGGIRFENPIVNRMSEERRQQPTKAHTLLNFSKDHSCDSPGQWPGKSVEGILVTVSSLMPMIWNQLVWRLFEYSLVAYGNTPSCDPAPPATESEAPWWSSRSAVQYAKP